MKDICSLALNEGLEASSPQKSPRPESNRIASRNFAKSHRGSPITNKETMCNKPEIEGCALDNSSRMVIGDMMQKESKRDRTEDADSRSIKRQRVNGEDAVSTVSSSSESISISSEGIEDFSDTDVLCGRGGGTNLHPGNRHYRDLILSHRTKYDTASKTMKPSVARAIVKLIRDKGGRFLRKGKDGLFYEIGNDAAREKTSQALRHRTFEMRNKEDPTRRKEKTMQSSFGQSSGRSPALSSASEAGELVVSKGAVGFHAPEALSLASNGQEDKIWGKHESLHLQMFQNALSRQRLFEASLDEMYRKAQLRSLLGLPTEPSFNPDSGLMEGRRESVLPSLMHSIGSQSTLTNALLGSNGNQVPPSLNLLAAQNENALLLRAAASRSDRLSAIDESIRNALHLTSSTLNL